LHFFNDGIPLIISSQCKEMEIKTEVFIGTKDDFKHFLKTEDQEISE
jgi:hypothetical protein